MRPTSASDARRGTHMKHTCRFGHLFILLLLTCLPSIFQSSFQVPDQWGQLVSLSWRRVELPSSHLSQSHEQPTRQSKVLTMRRLIFSTILQDHRWLELQRGSGSCAGSASILCKFSVNWDWPFLPLTMGHRKPTWDHSVWWRGAAMQQK